MVYTQSVFLPYIIKTKSGPSSISVEENNDEHFFSRARFTSLITADSATFYYPPTAQVL